MKKLVISLLFVMQVCFVFAQSVTNITGKVVDSKTQKPLQDVVVSVQNSNLTEITDASGKFVLKNVSEESHLVYVKSAGYKDQLLTINVVKGQNLDLGVVVLEEDITQELQINLISINDNDLSDDNSGSESTSSLLQASRDAFNQAVAFNWGAAHYRLRGLDSEYGTTLINGVIMNKAFDGRPQYSNWGGLNDATRNQEFTTGLMPSDYAFGGIVGTNEINTRASLYRPGNRISMAGTNTNYNGRIMGTTSSGMRKDGWAYTISASRRFGDDGYFEGTTMSANSFLASVEKRISSNHSINFTTIYDKDTKGKTSPNTQEVIDLKGSQYNSYWGYMDGKRRNSRMKTVEEPIFILSDYWKVSPKTNINTNVSYQFGKVGNSRLTYQGVTNPDPTYYHNMPSYEISYYDSAGNWSPDFAQAEANKVAFLADGQLNWQQMINANEPNGKSVYTLYEDRTDDKTFTANTIINSQLSDNIVFNGGITFRNLKSHNFQNMLDLLGGSYYLDKSLYGVGADQQQQDLNNPNRQIHVGDTFGYNYNLFSNNIDAFTQFKFVYKKFDFFMTQSFSRSEYQREGLYKNGYYPTNSYGKSDKYSFDNFGFKGGITYKITGRQFLSVNGAYMTKTPGLKNVFNNARLNNNTVDGIQSELVSSADISYIVNAPKFKTRLTAYFSQIQNQTETSFFFADAIGSGSTSGLFVAETLTGIDKRNVGLEFGAEYPITSTLKATFCAAYGEYIYTSNPDVAVSVDANASATNPKPILDYGTAKIRNYRQSGTPQQAASIGLEYRDPKFWWVGANANYLGGNYVDIAPITRTEHFYDDEVFSPGVPYSGANTVRGEELLKQEKLNDFVLVNLIGGKSWKIKQSTIGFTANINNLFDVKYKSGGYEQARNGNFKQLDQDYTPHVNPNNPSAGAVATPVFGSKYFYGYGRTFLINLYINF
ncbi:MAG: hypothetical protein RL108_217 [Bacteroidota bacterium]|jgi:hypothetical protein